jgi:hypothetical protein
MSRCTPTSAEGQLKIDVLTAWVETEWLPAHPEGNRQTVLDTPAIINHIALNKLPKDFRFKGDYTYTGLREIECPVVTRISQFTWQAERRYQTGAFLYRFDPVAAGEPVEVLVLGTYNGEESYQLTVVSVVPGDFIPAWVHFANECARLENTIEPESKVIVVGGRTAAFTPTTKWDEIILPEKLKSDILEDVSSFFSKGIQVYTRLNLKPFRKLLLAGVPGTGKTMLCSALASWAIEQGLLVIYISSSQKWRDDEPAATFSKIQHALDLAANSAYPTLILLEEMDAYLHADQKAQVLNVLDGSEAALNPKGTLMICTTNYPEAIDERILKRPGRLDRIFIIPETKLAVDAEKMLRQYLGDMWQESHSRLVPKLVGYPGAFIREVAIHALTQVAYANAESLEYSVLEDSYKSLKEQLDARDDFLTQRIGIGLQPISLHTNGN